MTATALTVFLLQPKLIAVSPVYPRLALGKAWNEVGFFFWPLSVFTLINLDTHSSYHIVLA
jgi:hypothetical protein